MHTVAILAYDGMTGFETGLAAEIFGITELNEKFSAGITAPWYSVQLCAEVPEVRLLGGATVRTSYGLAELADADTVVIPSVRDIDEPVSPALVDALKAADRRGARLVSICSGAFALAEAGVLDGRSATTHWLYADAMQRRYPDVQIDRAPLYVDNGRVLTSAGCAAGLDLCLHIVRCDHGAAVANDVARRLVIAPHRALKAADRRGARLVSICSGAFALAEAGVLDGRSATTHWLYADAMQRRYPDVQIDRAPLYVDNGRVLTSAGCAAGLDLCLHIVRCDHGAAVANDVARRLVIAPHRAGGQAQYIETPVPEPAADGRIAAGMAWALEHLDTPITLDDLAAQCAMSRRSFLRQFAKATGSTPIKWLIEQRVLASLPLLESSLLSVEQVSARVGFESPVTFRYHFVRQMHTTPSEYRSCFAGAVAP